MAAYRIINLRYAGKGDGSTPMSGPTRARIVGNTDIKTAQTGVMLAGAWKTGAAPQVIIEFEGLTEALLAVKGSLALQVLVLGYVADNCNWNLTIGGATATAVGESRFPPAEGSGKVPRVEITFDIHKMGDVDTLAECIVDATDAGGLACTTDPLVNLVSALGGATGVTAIDLVVEATLRCTMAKAISRGGGDELPAGVYIKSCEPQVVITVEDLTTYLAAFSGAVIDETLKLNYIAGVSGAKCLTVKWARRVGVEEMPINPAEDSGTVGRGRIVFKVVLGTNVTGPATALVVT